jgi:hypothetical protein
VATLECSSASRGRQVLVEEVEVAALAVVQVHGERGPAGKSAAGLEDYSDAFPCPGGLTRQVSVSSVGSVIATPGVGVIVCKRSPLGRYAACMGGVPPVRGREIRGTPCKALRIATVSSRLAM